MQIVARENNIMDADPYLQTIILIVLIIISSVLSAGEAAIVCLSEQKLRRDAEENDKRALKLLHFTDNPVRFTSAVNAGNLIITLFCVVIILRWTQSILKGFPELSSNALMMLIYIIVIILSAFLVVLLGQTVPRRIGSFRPEGAAYTLVYPFYLLYCLFVPFAVIMELAGRGVVRIFGVDPNHEHNRVTEEEIRQLVDAGNEKGVIEESQKDMINNVFEFDDRTAGDIMTHRTDISCVEETATIADVVKLAISDGYSRIPVYHDNLDTIIGIVYVKDLLKLIGDGRFGDYALRDFIRPALYVPDSKRCRELFALLTAKKQHMAVVVDEYGGTYGIVTMEDIVESIVGNIQDEYDNEEQLIKAEGDGYILDGSVGVHELHRLFDLMPDDDEDYDTVGGLIVNILERIPDDGECPQVVYQDVLLSVLSVAERRIKTVKAVMKKEGEQNT